MTAIGGNGLDDDTPLTASYQWTGPKTGTGPVMVANQPGTYTVTATVICKGNPLTTSETWLINEKAPDAINFNPEVTDDGSSEPNFVGHVLSAEATDITGGVNHGLPISGHVKVAILLSVLLKTT